ncbi:helix-turn-helix transcriptional regulator [Clostridium sp. UBA1353]|uniref:helix-turn-helix domain-containing protein n=1 Tax=Clostridium sp. UBA1353 TaxID=1946347 RepID=UPI003216734F
MISRNIVGPNVRKYRLLKNLTQEQLTARIQIKGIDFDRTMLSKIETQIREVLDCEIKAIAESLNIPIEYLFEEKNKL